MAASLLDSLTGLITPDLASKAASMFGESDSSVRKGMTGALPVVLSGLASRAGDSGFAGSLFDLVRSPANDDNVLNDLGGLLGGGTSSPMMGLGGKLLSTLFGCRRSRWWRRKQSSLRQRWNSPAWNDESTPIEFATQRVCCQQTGRQNPK